MIQLARRSPTTSHPHAAALEERLRRSITGEVRFGAGDRAIYATDGGNYRQVPIGVVLPRSVDDIVATVAACREHGAPILPRGGGTSLAGQCCNVAVVMDTTKYVNRVLHVDAAARRATVEPGCYLDRLRDAAWPHGLTFGPDPSTHTHCSMGGMIGNDSCGVRSMLSEFHGPGPRTSHQVHELDVLTADGLRLRVGPTSEAEIDRIVAGGGRRGEIYARLRMLRDQYADLIRRVYPRIQRRVSGYNLPALLPEHGFHVGQALSGSEGTCVTYLGATLALVPRHAERVLVVLGYPSVYEAADHVPLVREFRPIGLEGMDDVLADHVRKKGMHPDALGLYPEGKGWLIVEFGAEERAEALERAHAFADALRREPDAPTIRIHDDPAAIHGIWEIRESGLGATAFVPGEPDTWEGWEDSAVPVEHVGDYLRDLRALYERYGYRGALYGHFGQGCIHTRINFDLTSAEGIARFERFTQEAAELVVGKYGGSISGEHGDGQARGDLLRTMFGDELLEAFREFKAIWDPDGLMNPGKVIDARPRTADLRLGAGYRPWEPATHFAWPEDHGSFAHATLRCVGVGKCRRHEGGTMCPSFMVLRDERYTTRGRAHLFFEMLQGEAIADGWRSEDVKESMDLCLSCKGCTGDCPVNVDIPTYKAEFLSHYYAGRLRPRHAYAIGWIQYWARLGRLAPWAANLLTQTPGLDRLAKLAAGVAPERTIPRFAPRPFTTWFRTRPVRDPQAPRVILWPDTFNDHFHPGTLAAGAEVLEAAGFRPAVPRQWLCCGRPLYDFGFLDLAKAHLRRIMDALDDDVQAGVPIVGLEPSCVAVFRDELPKLFPGDPRARRLREQVFTLGEFLRDHRDRWQAPRLEREAVLHGHCHHRAIMKLGGEQAVLGAMGLDLETLDAGCCGMAGAFGFEAGHYELSTAVGERVLLPRVREAPPRTMIVADGFSCREQIAQETAREGVHLAEVVQLALHPEAHADGRPPEQVVAGLAPAGLQRPRLAPALAAGGVLLAGVLLRRWRRRVTARRAREAAALAQEAVAPVPAETPTSTPPDVPQHAVAAPDVVEDAIRAVHAAFGLPADLEHPAETWRDVAVVPGGNGHRARRGREPEPAR